MFAKINLPGSAASVLVFLFGLAFVFAFAHAAGRRVSADSAPAGFANFKLAIAVGQDGLAAVNTTADTLNGRAVCPSNPTAGCDFSLNNGVIYNYDYSVYGADEDVTLTVVAPLGTVWNVLPASADWQVRKGCPAPASRQALLK